VGRGIRHGALARGALLLALMATRMPSAADTAVRPASLGARPSGVYEALARSADDGALLELPMGGGLDPRGSYRESAYMLASTLHWKPLVNGYSGYLPPTYELLSAIARRLPEAGALQEMVDMAGLRWVVVHQPRGPMIRRGLGIRDGNGVMFISHTGDVQPSGFLPLTAGNVRSENPLQIYRTSPLFQSLRRTDQFEGRCGVCEFQEICGGSRARAYAATGNALGSDPLCAYQPGHALDARLSH